MLRRVVLGPLARFLVTFSDSVPRRGKAGGPAQKLEWLLVRHGGRHVPALEEEQVPRRVADLVYRNVSEVAGVAGVDPFDELSPLVVDDFPAFSNRSMCGVIASIRMS